MTREGFIGELRSKLISRISGRSGLSVDPDTVPTLIDRAYDDDPPDPAYVMESPDTPVAAPGRQLAYTERARGGPVRDRSAKPLSSDPPPGASVDSDLDHILLQVLSLQSGMVARQDAQDSKVEEVNRWAFDQFTANVTRTHREYVAIGVIAVSCTSVGFVVGAIVRDLLGLLFGLLSALFS